MRFKKELLFLASLAVLAGLVFFLRPSARRPASPTQPATTVPSPAPVTRPAAVFAPERPALQPAAPAAGLPRSPLADGLHATGTTARDDLRILRDILNLYRERFGAYPAFGDNAQLVNALAGANPQRLGLLPRDVPAINPATGELQDRWGTPYVFHSISRSTLELRTAGPDRIAYTEDDVMVLAGAPQKE